MRKYDKINARCLNAKFMKDDSSDTYSAHMGVNQSMLKDVLSVSPAFAYHRKYEAEREETPAMKIGTAVHMAALEPDKFIKSYASLPVGLDRRKTEHKAIYNEFLAEHGGKVALKAEEFLEVVAMADAVRPHIVAGPGNHTIEVEKAIEGLFELSNDGQVFGAYEAKGRLDCLVYTTGHITIRDIKTVADIGNVPGASYNGLWCVQAAYYVDMVDKLLQPPVDVSFEYVCVSKEAPYDVRIFVVSDEMLIKGRQAYAKGFTLYNDWLHAGKPDTASFFGREMLNG